MYAHRGVSSLDHAVCGITGFVDYQRRVAEPKRLLGRMADTITHRGPDAGRTWVCPNKVTGFGHRRLSIIDLSEEGSQPMTSASGRFVLCYNGEIYNFPDLRKELESGGATFRGASDTEVLLAAIEAWGLEVTLPKLNGMFAFALWDAKDDCVYLVRDRLGIKPLYYGFTGGLFAFGSELKSLQVIDGFANEIDPDSLALYLRLMYLPAPHSIYRDVNKLRPGHYLRYRPADRDTGPKQICWWDARAVAEAARKQSAPTLDELDATLRDAVRVRMVSDVPIGCFLSGGIDSSLVTALMQAESKKPVKTFAIGFDLPEYNEAVFAAAVARHLGTDHTELYVSPDTARDVIPMLPEMYDEPFADSSQIPTYLVSRMARERVTVCLSGDGGDELFGGYTRYLSGEQIWSSIGNVPLPLRRGLSKVLLNSPDKLLDHGLGFLSGRLRKRFGKSGPVSDSLKKAAKLFRHEREELYRRQMSYWQDPAAVVPGANEPNTVLSDGGSWLRDSSYGEHMMFADMLSYLPGDILTKVDRASMAVSLESRVPILDYRVYEMAWRYPVASKMNETAGKRPLRDLLARYVPRELFERPKRGFAVPVSVWMRNELRDWCESLLSESRLRETGLFDPAPVRSAWQEHLSGEQNREHHIWAVLMFQAWYDQQRSVMRTAA